MIHVQSRLLEYFRLAAPGDSNDISDDVLYPSEQAAATKDVANFIFHWRIISYYSCNV